MQITFKLFAGLSDRLPVDARRSNALLVEIPDGSNLAQLIDAWALPPRMVHLVLVNGEYVAPAKRAERQLSAGDVVAIWPPIAGG